MKAVVQHAVRGSDASVLVEDVDISGDADLEARYGIEIPVLMIDGRKAAKYRVTASELRRLLAARTAGEGWNRRGGQEG
jgi:hypothetical protein